MKILSTPLEVASPRSVGPVPPLSTLTGRVARARLLTGSTHYISRIGPIGLICLIGLIAVFALGAKTAEASILLKSPPNNMGLVGFWNFNAGAGTAVADSSGSGNTGTWAGTGSHWTNGKFSNGGSFNGTDDYVSVPDANSLKFGTGNFTLSFWIKSTIGSSYGSIIDKAFAINVPMYYVLLGSNGALDFRVTGTGGAGILDTERGSGFNDGSWHHGVLTIDRANNILKVYKDGVQAGTNVDISSVTGSVDPSDDLRIGYTNSGSYPFPGSIDEVRIYNRALSATEVRTLYNSTGAGKIKNAERGLVAYYPMSEGAGTTTADATGQGNTGTLTNFALSTSTSNWENSKFGKGLNFDGVDDYVTSANVVTPVTATVSAWIKPSTATDNTVVSLGTTASADKEILSVGVMCASSYICYAHWAGGWNLVSSNVTPVAGTWYHVVGINDGTDIKIYVDGVLKNTTTGVGGSVGTQNIRIGRRWSGTSYFPGSIDDVRVYNRALTATEIADMYSNGLSGISPQKIKLGVAHNLVAPSNLVGWWTFDGPDLTTTTATDKSGSGNNGTLTNGPVPTRGKIGQALKFDGVDDYVNAGSGSSLDNLKAGGGISISLWLKYPGTGSYALVAKNYYLAWLFSIENGKLSFLHPTDAISLSVTTDSDILSANQWQQVSMTWDGSATATNVHFYVNGVEKTHAFNQNGSGTLVNDAAHNLYLGTWDGASAFFNGSIDDVRIYNKALSSAEVLQLYNMGK